MRAFLLSLPFVFVLSVMAHAVDLNARSDQNGNIELQDSTGAWIPADIRTRSRGGVVHVPPGIDPLEINNVLDLRQIAFFFDGYRYFVIHMD